MNWTNLLNKGDRIFRHEVPVDDAWHSFEMAGPPLFVACRQSTTVEFWTRAGEGSTVETRSFLVVGTGHEIPEDVRYWGTAIAPGGHLVWHLLEIAS